MIAHIQYARGARVRFRSIGNSNHVFTGQITGYSDDRLVALIRDDGFPTSRPVRVDRIIGFAIAGDMPRVVA